MDSYHGSSNKVEILDTIFVADKGNIKILLLKKETEPYKGYWSLPRGILPVDSEVLEEADIIAVKLSGLNQVNFFLNRVYSTVDRIPDERVIGISCIGLTDPVTISLKGEDSPFEYGWFNINSLPKMIYDHSKIALDSIHDLKKIISDVNVIKKFFPSDFTLPELQSIYEQVSGEELDRRNFRKKLMSMDILESTGEHNLGETGRPAKLYRFKDDIGGSI